jgi:hypothetical protein
MELYSFSLAFFPIVRIKAAEREKREKSNLIARIIGKMYLRTAITTASGVELCRIEPFTIPVPFPASARPSTPLNFVAYPA